MKSDLFFEEARLGPRDSALIEHDEKPHLVGVKRRFHDYVHVDLAHVVMLMECEILDSERGGSLVRSLGDIYDLGPDEFPWDPRSGSCLVQFERYLTERCGEDVAGRLQTGRSRNDQEGAVERLYCRDQIVENAAALHELTTVVLTQAGQHLHTIMPGYTHLQHAQPWTFAHYLMRQAYIFERDFQRLRELYGRTDLSALGGAAQAGTSWPIDRARTAELLGHAGIVANANDAGEFARDHLEECVAMLAIMMSNVGRMATDLYVWSSWEFSLLEIDDGLAGTSSIMPQKKNPHALERIKALAGQSTGWLVSVMACQRGVLSTDLDMVFGDDILSNTFDSCASALALLTECVRTVIVNESVMRERANVYWSTASHLADEIVRRFDVSFRTAHHIVGAFVKASIDAQEPVSAASSARLDEAAQQYIGRSLALGDQLVRELLDAQTFIETRVSAGSVSPTEVARQVEDVASLLKAHGEWLTRTRTHNEMAMKKLRLRAQELGGA